jgi:hypothetical protein
MAFVLKNRVLETCTSPGTGAVSLLGATSGYNTFAGSIGDGNTTYYTIADQSGSNWEVGIGTYSAGGNNLTRSIVLSNSLGTTALINFSSGTQNVFVSQPAEASPVPNFTTDETQQEMVNLLVRMLNYLNAPQGYDKSQQRQRGTVVVEQGTIGTVTTVGTVTTLNNQVSIGGVQAQILPNGANLSAWASTVRARIT